MILNILLCSKISALLTTDLEIAEVADKEFKRSKKISFQILHSLWKARPSFLRLSLYRGQQWAKKSNFERFLW